MDLCEETDKFWDYSIAVYAREGVRPVLLELQDRHGADVNILLYCLYAGSEHGRRLGHDDLAAAIRAVKPWNEAAVWPLRAIRIGLKQFAGAADFRAEISRLELMSERQAQSRILEALPPLMSTSGSAELASQNLLRYVGDVPLLRALVEAALD